MQPLLGTPCSRILISNWQLSGPGKRRYSHFTDEQRDVRGQAEPFRGSGERSPGLQCPVPWLSPLCRSFSRKLRPDLNSPSSFFPAECAGNGVISKGSAKNANQTPEATDQRLREGRGPGPGTEEPVKRHQENCICGRNLAPKRHPPLPSTRLTDFCFQQLCFFMDLFMRKGQGTTPRSTLSLPRVPVPAVIMPSAPFLHGFDTPKSS